MSIHDETWDRPICEHCQKEIPYGYKLFHRQKRCINKAKIYRLQLEWKKEKDKIYGQVHRADIWSREYLRIENNGENWYNIHLFNRADHEIDSIGGARLLSDAKKEAEDWVDEQLKLFMVRE